MMRDSLLYFFINEILLFIFSLSFLKYNHMLGEKNGKIALNSLKRDTTRKDFIRLLRKRKKRKGNARNPSIGHGLHTALAHINIC